MIVIGSNTTEAHPIVANRMIEAARAKTAEIAVYDVRKIQLSKFATHSSVLPYESNLLFLNAIAYVILSENLYNQDFIDTRTKEFEAYKKSILEDKFANPEYFRNITGYEDLADEIPIVARKYW
jgi:formate dehydrogenase major subunit